MSELSNSQTRRRRHHSRRDHSIEKDNDIKKTSSTSLSSSTRRKHGSSINRSSTLKNERPDGMKRSSSRRRRTISNHSSSNSNLNSSRRRRHRTIAKKNGEINLDELKPKIKNKTDENEKNEKIENNNDNSNESKETKLQPLEFKKRAKNRESIAGFSPSSNASNSKKISNENETIPPITLSNKDENECAKELFGENNILLFEKLRKELFNEGLFRIPGNQSEIEKWNNDISKKNKKKVLKFIENCSIYTISSILKKEISKISKELILPENDSELRILFQMAEESQRLGVENNDDEISKSIIDEMKTKFKIQNRNSILTFRFICRFFFELIQFEKENKMNLSNLLTCIGPTLSFAPGWIKWSILKFDLIFNDL